MNRIKAWLRFVLGFSQTEANAFLILLPVMALVICSSPVYRTLFLYEKPDLVAEKKALDSLIATLNWDDVTQPENKQTAVGLTTFDPNTAAESTLVSLGISKKVAGSIGRYRTKGGRFRVKKDLAKIYGMDTGVYITLVPYILLPDSIPKATPPTRQQTERKTSKKSSVPFDLNKGDTIALQSIYGIGPALARRIVQYRDRLGGFLTPDQLFEIWGLDSVVVERVQERTWVDPDFAPIQLPINQSTEQELAQHPYIRTKIARAIVKYRFQHGPFRQVDDLMKIATLDEKAFLRIKPYISLD